MVLKSTVVRCLLPLLLATLSSCALFPKKSYAQIQFSRPKNAVAGYTLSVEIRNQQDLDYLETNLPQFTQVQRVKVNAPVDIAAVSHLISKMDNLEELLLQSYTGVLSDDDLTHLEWLNSLVLYIPEGTENNQLLNANWSLMQGVTLVFSSIPDDYSFLASWKQCKRLNLVGPFDINSCKPAIAACQQTMPQLVEFGISLDRVYHLSADVKLMPSLKRLNIIDNLSWATEKDLWNYGDVAMKLGFTDKINQGKITKNLFRSLDFHYLSVNPELIESEKQFLTKLFPDVAAPKEEASWMDVTEGKKFDFAERLTLEGISSRGAFPKPLTKPLFPQFQDGWYEFLGSTATDQLFSVEGKAMILVPKEAMITSTGKPFSGSYTFRVKWMDNAVRQLAYGVTQNRDSIGQKFPLSSVLVVDMQAYSGTQNLQLNPNAKIELRFVCDPNPWSRMYAFDTANGGKWENFYEYDYKFDDGAMVRIDFTEFYSGVKTASTGQTTDFVPTADRISKQGFNYLLGPDETRAVIEKYIEYAVKKSGTKAQNEKQFVLKRGASTVGIRRHPSKTNPENGVFEFNIYDKTEWLFPDLKSISNYPLAFSTAMERKLVMQDFFRVQKFWDYFFFKSGDRWFLQLRGTDGLWQIELLQPKNRYKSNPRLAKLEQMKFDKLMSKVVMIQTQRHRTSDLYMQNEWKASVNQSSSAALDVAAPPKGMVRNAFRVRSLGRFAFAQPVTLDSGLQLTMVMANAGKAPLDVQRCAIVFKDPQRIVWFQASNQYNLSVNPAKVSAIIVEDKEGQIYGINGDEFRKLEELKNNLLFYLPLNPLGEKQLNKESLELLLYGKKFKLPANLPLNNASGKK